MWLVAQPMDPAYAIDHAALDPMDIVLLRPLQALLKTPITAVEGICMKTDLDHVYYDSYSEKSIYFI